jgi:hypothetical protein
MKRYATFALSITAATLLLTGNASAGHRYRQQILTVPVYASAPIVRDLDPYAAYSPCIPGVTGCMRVFHSLPRMACAVNAVTGRGYNNAQMLANLRVALAAGCGGILGPVAVR